MEIHSFIETFRTTKNDIFVVMLQKHLFSIHALIGLLKLFFLVLGPKNIS